MKDRPLVSFGIPTYNRSDKLHISVDSILRQGYDNIEIIISDNASEDGTQTICEEMARQDDRIKYFRQKTNLGLIGNWDFVHQQATGKYYMHLADDDWMEEGVLSKYVDFMEKNPDYAICSGQFARWLEKEIWFIEQGFNIEDESPEQRVLETSKIMVHCGMYYGLVRREYMKKVKPRMMIQHDWLIVSSLAYQGKIKNFDYIGYNKLAGGISSEWSEGYARNVGASHFASHFSYYVTGKKTFSDILYKNDVYKPTPFLKRMVLGLKCWWHISKNQYIDPVKKSGKAGFEVHILKPSKSYLKKYKIYKYIKKANELRKNVIGAK